MDDENNISTGPGTPQEENLSSGEPGDFDIVLEETGPAPAAGGETPAVEAQPDAVPWPGTAPSAGAPGTSPQGVPPYGGYPYGGAPTRQPPYYGKAPSYTPPYYQQPAQYGQTPPPAPPKKGKTRGLKVFLAVLLCVALLCSGVAVGSLIGSRNKDSGNNTTQSEETTADGPTLNIDEDETTNPAQSGETNSPVEIAKKVKPSVVGIIVSTENQGFGGDDAVSGEGSGIIMSEDASGKYTYIITCAHVISDAGISISVQLEDGTQYDAEMVGFDVRTDIGVIKIKASGLPAAEFGSSDALQVGEQVYAVGNPGGVEFFGSFTSGVVSAIDRPVSSEIGYTMKCIQHDASINPGNSGGALVNSKGQVVGINSLKIISDEYEGMGFAIPISDAKDIINSLTKYGYVQGRPKLGITYYQATAYNDYNMLIKMKGLPAGSLIIESISSDSALAGTEAKSGDLIIAVNGKDLDNASILLEAIEKGKVGDQLKLTLCHISKNYDISRYTVTVTLVEDRGTSVPAQEETTTNAYDYFYNP